MDKTMQSIKMFKTNNNKRFSFGLVSFMLLSATFNNVLLGRSVLFVKKKPVYPEKS